MVENRVKKVVSELNAVDEIVNGGNSIAGDGVLPKAYQTPVLVAYGDVRDITLGPTNGEGESGAALFFRVPPP